MRACSLSLEQPHQRRLGDQVGRQLRQNHSARQANRDFVSDLINRGAVRGEQGGGHEFVFAGEIVLVEQLDFLAHVFFE